MKSVLISIKPKYCELIANGKKTVEVRKNRPKLETPFKCYIYCTKPKPLLALYNKELFSAFEEEFDYYNKNTVTKVNGKVIGEFVCDDIRHRTLSSLLVKEDAEKTLCGTCLSNKEVLEYLGYKENTSIFDCKHYIFYCWHISDLKIYDKPKELSEFKRINHECYFSDLGLAIPECRDCKYRQCMLSLSRPPKSWCYVEELRE